MPLKPNKSKFDYSITTRAHAQGTAFDLYYKWPRTDKARGVKGVRHRPLLGYNLTEAEAHRAAIAMIHKIHEGARKATPHSGRCFTLG